VRCDKSQRVLYVARLWKRLTSPNRKTARAVEAIEEALKTASNTTSALWEDQMAMFEQLLSCCQDTRRGVRAFTGDADLLLKKIEGALINIAFQDEQRAEALESHFKHQREFFDRSLALSCPTDKPAVSNKFSNRYM
jgi:hypothetical protein